MVRGFFGAVFAAALVYGGVATQAKEFTDEIDLTSFGQETDQASREDVSLDLPIHEVVHRIGSVPRRFYLTGMIGPSFANLMNADPMLESTGSLFNAGGAVGMAFERQRGQLRLEVEGMGRSNFREPYTVDPAPGEEQLLFNNWSVMQNVWRDLMITSRFGAYGGGGIGGGGYTLGQRSPSRGTSFYNPKSAFAWQAGGGIFWDATDRLTFDVGYRYYQINAITQEQSAPPDQFAASEVMFSLRFYEPFRNWRR